MSYTATATNGATLDIPAALSIEDARRIACEALGVSPWQVRVSAQQEIDRKAIFRSVPGLSAFLATALEDLQHTESDEACEQEREERDSGTIYDCPDETLAWARDIVERFNAAQLGNIEACGLSWDRIGSTLYMEVVGHGVSFTDDIDTPCTRAMSEWADRNRCEGLYFGDDGKVYA